ncbi:MAG: UDP-3-O-(3-hydroxymyristoyl)glucosamine N-acyltransferase [Acidobacteria bacterium]|nr:UDP-3-O-(3-hydroxymyristoyl)glucosamine N-acyltransferase [Acidobacteriota bacterium]
MEKTLRELAQMIAGSVIGDPEARITGIKSFEEAGHSDLVLVSQAKFLKEASESIAGAFLVGEELVVKGRNMLRVSNPKLAFATVLRLFHPPESLQSGVHPTAYVDDSAVVHPSARVGAFVYVGPGCSLGGGCQIFPGTVLLRDVSVGAETTIFSNVSIYSKVEIGSGTIIHAGSVIGSDGYGFVFDGQQHVKIPQVGGVKIGNQVEVGANCCIDRATLGVTEVRDGVKLDNFVHIGHNCVVGEHSLLVAQVGLSGGTRLGKFVTLAGQVGTNPHIEIGDGTVVMAKSGVSKSLSPHSTVSGMPPIEHHRWIRSQIIYARLPEIYQALKDLQEEVERLKQERTNGAD